MESTSKTHEFYVKFLTDDGTIKNRTNFIVYMLEYPAHLLFRKNVTLLGESALTSSWRIGAHLSGSSMLLGESSLIAIFTIGVMSYNDKATFEVTSDSMCISAIVSSSVE